MRKLLARTWLGFRFFDSLFAFYDGGLAALAHFRRTIRQRRQPKPCPVQLALEGLEERRLMDAVSFQSSSFHVDEDDGPKVITVQLLACAVLTTDASVLYELLPDSATEDVDYERAVGTLTF